MEDSESILWLPDDIPPGHLTVENEFWDLFSDMVALVYMTDPSERLGIIEPLLEEAYGTTNTRTYERIENTALRVVAWMETWNEGK